ncbi:MAG: Uma2 family endonuclease [Gemmatimonadetes bacterium]|nr:Uma2 family endonuclease [Gemmatimonadota bacterium]
MAEVWTVARWRELPPVEGKTFEVIEGELVVSGIPAYRHSRAVEELSRLVDGYVRERGIGELHHHKAPVFINDYNVFLPDFVVFPPGGHVTEWEELGPPLLAVEVLSPSSAKYDRGAKRVRYQDKVAEYWIVDLDARLVERWRPRDERPEVLRDQLKWKAGTSTVELVIDLGNYFLALLGC